MVQSAGALRGVNLWDSFTRPAGTTTYTNGDLVANSATAALVAALSFGTRGLGDPFLSIRRVKLTKSDPSLTAAKFRVHLFDTDPCATAPTNGDDGAFAPAASAGYLGHVDITCDQAFGDDAVGFGEPDIGWEIVNTALANGRVWALVEARGAYAAAAEEVFTVALELSKTRP